MKFSLAVWVLVDSLACFRATRLVNEDAIFDRPRDWLSGEGKGKGQLAGHPKMKTLLLCPWCVSIYLGAGIVALTKYEPHYWSYVALAFALSAVAGILATVVN